jgi:hypothetical protein
MVEVAALVPSAGVDGGGLELISKPSAALVTSTMIPVSLVSGQLVPVIVTM